VKQMRISGYTVFALTTTQVETLNRFLGKHTVEQVAAATGDVTTPRLASVDGLMAAIREAATNPPRS